MCAEVFIVEKLCADCNKSFKVREWKDGRRVGGSRRKRCFDCQPRGNKRMGGISKRESFFTTCFICDRPIETKIKTNRCCQTCKSRIRKLAIKSSAIEYLGGKCFDCGRVANIKDSFDIWDFHHLDPEKKDFEIGSKAAQKTLAQVKDELDKCILLCAICHRQRHAMPVSDEMMNQVLQEKNLFKGINTQNKNET